MSDVHGTAAGPAPSLDGRYDVLRPISEGGSAIVYETVHHETGRRCAVKVLRPALRQQKALGRRLLREARMLTRVRHPSVVEVVDAGVCPSWGSFMVMELLEGRTIEDVLAARTRLSLEETLDVLSPIAEALTLAHMRGVVHRDVKPANVVVTMRADGAECVKLIDWGLARFARDTGDGAETGGEGERVGTAGYAAPEQWQGRPAGPAADGYSLAVTIVECLVGSLPAPSRGHATLDLSTLTLPATVSQEMKVALTRELQADPSERLADPRELVASLARAAGYRPRATTLLGQPSRGATPEAATRRAYPRAAYRTPARVKLAAGPTVDGHIVDVSEGGVQIVAQQVCAKDSVVQLRMSLPLRGDVVTVDAKVRWVRGAGGLHAIGLELCDAPADVRAAIAKYVGLMGGR